MAPDTTQKGPRELKTFAGPTKILMHARCQPGARNERCVGLFFRRHEMTRVVAQQLAIALGGSARVVGEDPTFHAVAETAADGTYRIWDSIGLRVWPDPGPP